MFKVKAFFKLEDLWIGVYIDRQKRAIYICPIPMIGIKIQWQGDGWDETVSNDIYDLKREVASHRGRISNIERRITYLEPDTEVSDRYNERGDTGPETMDSESDTEKPEDLGW